MVLNVRKRMWLGAVGLVGWILAGGVQAADARARAAAPPFHPTAPAVTYRCLFNHDSAIFCTFTKGLSPQDSGPAYLASFIEKLADTDIDLVLMCGTAMRANLFPSEVDPQWRRYHDGQVSPKWRGFDYIMKYIHDGGDPVAETLAACRRAGKDFFISYRMNDAHYIVDKDFPTHPAFWRDHPEYWLGDSDISATFKPDEDNVRLHNYLLQPVRDWYFAIIEELCTNYDLDGVELDFQRAPRFFHNDEIDAGRAAMTGFVRRVRRLLDDVGARRGKSLKLCVRIPETVAKCAKVGLDVFGWDELELIDMVNLSSYYLHSLDLDIEAFRAGLGHARLYAEMQSRTHAIRAPSYSDGLRYTTLAAYRAAALNFLARGADGLSFFNFDYIPHGAPSFHEQRRRMAQGLKGITDVEFLRSQPKHYVMVPYRDERLMVERYRMARNDATVEVVIPDDTRAVEFCQALLRVETQQDIGKLALDVRLNGRPLAPVTRDETELFPPVVTTGHGYPTAAQVRFYDVPLADIVPGANTFAVHNRDPETHPCDIVSLELALYR